MVLVKNFAGTFSKPENGYGVLADLLLSKTGMGYR
jgi:hypothetical protein